MRPIDLTGMVFGRLTAISKSPAAHRKGRRWICSCTCGNTHIAATTDLRSGSVKSCGCLSKDKPNHLKHGQAIDGMATDTYKSWANMRFRVLNKNGPYYKDYGGRGIIIDPAWDDFEVFFKDMGERPSGTSLDRIDNDKIYTKTNCQWSNKAEQANNRRSNVMITWRGETKPLGVWASHQGLAQLVLYKRIFTHKWDMDRAMTQPARLQPSRPPSKPPMQIR